MIKDIIDISDFVEVQTEQKVIADLVNRFIKRRKEYGLTQQKLSERSGVSYGSIRRFESKGEISFTSLVKISSILGLLDEFNSLFKKPIIKSLRR
ncbi:Transcriptional regulator [Alteracholeplasma palmae J233]|uniref:Transcriptional regulator n=1 Tax=Alteracholeplasma palmae (strain ATCC 49389 / J233) TaxID=1318466 RepID=U4KK70_ALTPJ|nr:helix-turn-helix transcriptional regulator [Alteracholeplasma palmae]CCV63908.1 Transcriptional regulator [Alteracholeplasma palmae J233]